MDGPAFVRPAGNGPKGETGTTVKNQKTGGFLRPEGALIPPPQDAAQHRMGVEVHLQSLGKAFMSSALSFVREVVFGVGFTLLLPVFFHLDGVLYSMPLSDILTFVIAVVLIKKIFASLKEGRL